MFYYCNHFTLLFSSLVWRQILSEFCNFLFSKHFKCFKILIWSWSMLVIKIFSSFKNGILLKDIALSLQIKEASCNGKSDIWQLVITRIQTITLMMNEKVWRHIMTLSNEILLTSNLPSNYPIFLKHFSFFRWSFLSFNRLILLQQKILPFQNFATAQSWKQTVASVSSHTTWTQLD